MSEAAKCTWKTPSFVLIPDSNPLEPHAQIEDLLLLQYPQLSNPFSVVPASDGNPASIRKASRV
jgi:hypothetical protein